MEALSRHTTTHKSRHCDQPAVTAFPHAQPRCIIETYMVYVCMCVCMGLGWPSLKQGLHCDDGFCSASVYDSTAN